MLTFRPFFYFIYFFILFLVNRLRFCQAKFNKPLHYLLAVDREKKKWRDILHRLLDITLFLANQNLAFRGHQEKDSWLNRGNLFEMVEMLSKYDPVLEEHLMRLKRHACTVKASVS